MKYQLSCEGRERKVNELSFLGHSGSVLGVFHDKNV